MPASHQHQWVQWQMEVWPSPSTEKPIAGLTIVWRCRGRGCDALYAQRIPIRKPSSKAQGNMWGRPTSGLVDDGLVREIQKRKREST